MNPLVLFCRLNYCDCFVGSVIVALFKNFCKRDYFLVPLWTGGVGGYEGCNPDCRLCSAFESPLLFVLRNYIVFSWALRPCSKHLIHSDFSSFWSEYFV